MYNIEIMLHILGAFLSLFSSGASEAPSELDTDGLIDVKNYPGTKIVDLIVYPLTGAEGIHLTSASIKMSGFELDREWVALEKDFDVNTPYTKKKRFLTVSKSEALGQTKVRLETRDSTRYLILTHPNQHNEIAIDVDHPKRDQKIEFINNQNEMITCYSEGDEASEWISNAIDKDVILARSQYRAEARTLKGQLDYQMIDGDKRNAGHYYAALHIISMKSIEELQTHIDPQECIVSTKNFRPNIVVEGVDPLEEEDVRKFTILDKDLTFRVIYNTGRCKETCYDDDTKKLLQTGEPLKTLTKLRYLDKVGPVFGLFAQPDKECEISIGDIIMYTKKTPTPTKYM